MKKFFLFFLFLFFTGCASSLKIRIPGETAVIKKNIASEYMSIAEEYNKLEKYEQAAKYYKKAMEDKNLYWAAYYKLGRCYAMLKQWHEADSIYSVLYLRDKNNIDIKMSLAYIKAMEGNLKDALSMYEELSKQQPDNQEISENYINMIIADKNYSLANEHLQKFKEKFKDNKNIEVFEKKIIDATKVDAASASSD